ncbi:NAD(P)H-hydrate dehydratase [Croceiramulus getboli]|nr:NAD(P)H-hydrate dehydratase [Flavobacteriaceae bacterium YJPT1-3]
MKIFSRKQLREADQVTLKKEGIPSINLMERAGGYAYQWLHQRLQGGQVPIKIFCGIGNNGGDGLVIARYLLENGYQTTVYIVNYSDKRSEDFLKALDSLKEKTTQWPELLKSASYLPEINSGDIVIDAIFGIGLNRPAPDWVQQLFAHINASKAYVLAIDIPSGLYMDAVPATDEEVISASYVLSFQSPKLVFFLPQTGKYVQMWETLDIGLDRDYLINTPTDVELIGKQEILQMYRPRQKFSHKGTYGHSMLVGGSFGKMGAVVLATRAALRTGSGLATAYVPQLGVDIVQTALPEAMVLTDNFNGKTFEEIDYDIEPDVIGIGVGMGTDSFTKKALTDFLDDYEGKLVVDADALNCIAADPKLLEDLPNQAVLTPHPKELERLIGSWEDDFDKLEKTAAFAKIYDVIVVIKGAHTITVYDYRLYVNTTGNPGMATAGAGDVLTGMITGLIAQGYGPLQAAVFAVYLHGRAGDLAVPKTSYQGLLAGDLVDHIGAAFMDLFSEPEPAPEQD